MNGKKAKALRRLVSFNPNEKRDYTEVIHGKRKKLLITQEATFKEEIVDLIQLISNESRRKYKIAKRIYKNSRQKERKDVK